MPKEYIHSENHGRLVPFLIDGSDAAEGRTEMREMDHDSIKLSWDKEHGQVILAVLDFEKDPDGLGPLSSDDKDRPPVKHISLDRQGVNRLIRFLRRARDDAFGRDE